MKTQFTITIKKTLLGTLYGQVKSRYFRGDVIPADGNEETARIMAEEIIAERKASFPTR